MSCCLYWVILEERLSVRVLASAVDDYNNSVCWPLTGQYIGVHEYKYQMERLCLLQRIYMHSFCRRSILFFSPADCINALLLQLSTCLLSAA